MKTTSSGKCYDIFSRFNVSSGKGLLDFAIDQNGDSIGFN